MHRLAAKRHLNPTDMKHGFYRVAAAAPKVTVADVASNTQEIITLMSEAFSKGADLLVFPEMSVTAYTCGDLFHNNVLLDAAVDALERLAAQTSATPGMVVIVGAPVALNNVVFNCAVILSDGKIQAYIPKTYIPNSNEFYEKRWFASGDGVDTTLNGAPFSADTIINHCGIRIAAEICEDVWAPMPPSSRLACAGAEIIANLSASDDLIGKYDYLRKLVQMQSARCLSGYVYASAGFGESSTDLVFDAKLFIYESGRLLKANKRWQRNNQLIISDIDIEALRHDRRNNTTFATSAIAESKVFNTISIDTCRKPSDSELLRVIDSLPFVPANGDILANRCEEVISIQVGGLAKRIDATHCKNLVIGISGGLDSTLALLVAVRTFDSMGLDRKGIIGVTMPGFGTTGRTYRNAITLMESLSVTVREISIVPAVEQHFKDISHNPENHDVTYENSQARERTQILMDIANQVNGMVLGTGDLSELALGWATYNGDQMSMYGINAGVPKTLVKYLTRYFALDDSAGEERKALLDIIDTPISPELLPAAEDGAIEQKTEDLVGPYELHDFFLYYTLRYGFKPSRIFLLAENAFAGKFDKATILKWEHTFFRRFFTQQFKRSCMPDGPKVGSISLSPRGDWRMPSDASSAAWLADLDTIGI